MGYVEIAQIIFMVIVFAIALIGFMKVATEDKKKR